MKKKRLIPVVLLRYGNLVQSKTFSRYQIIGNPIDSVKRFSEWVSDELIYLDISPSVIINAHQIQHVSTPENKTILNIIEQVSKVTFMPLVIGGGVKTLKDIELRLAKGADKVSINRHALNDPTFIECAAKEFGSQCIVISIDYKLYENFPHVYSYFDKDNLGKNLYDWAYEVEARGAGEILLNSVDRDGMKIGYDIDVIAKVSSEAHIPIIALGGAGSYNDFLEALEKTEVDGVAAANIFQHIDQSVFLAKKFLFENGANIRPPMIFSRNS